MASIVTLTPNPAVDMFLEVPHLNPNRKLRCGAPLYAPGGGGVNVSRAIARLGGSSTALFLAGGATGDLLVQLLQREAVAIDRVAISAPTRENVHIVEGTGGREYRLTVPGPHVTSEEWQHLLRALRAIYPRPDFVVASGSLAPGMPDDFYGRLADLALKEKFRLIVDTSGEALRHAARKGTFLLKPNVQELMDTADGGELFSDQFIEGAAMAIQSAKGVDVVVVSAGGSGAFVVDQGGARRYAAPVVTAKSRTGAGDSMVAGIVVALARGTSIDEAVRFGIAAGSAALLSPAHELCTNVQATQLLSGVHERTLVPA